MDYKKPDVFLKLTHLLADAIALATIIVVGVILFDQSRFDPELGYDEGASVLGLSILDGHYGIPPDPLRMSRDLQTHHFDRHHVMNSTPPVYYVVSAVVFKVFGFGLEQSRGVSLFFLLATAALSYLAGRYFATPTAGLIALAAYLLVPLHLYQVIARPDVAGVFFTALGFVLLLALKRTSSWRMFLLAGLAYGLGVMSHYFVLFAGLLLAPMLCWQVGTRFWNTKTFWAYVGGFLLPVLALVVFVLNPVSVFQTFLLYQQATAGPAEQPLFARTALAHWEILNTSLRTFAVTALPSAATVLVLAGFWPALRQRLGEHALMAVIGFLALVAALSFYPNIQTAQYYSPLYLTVGALALGLVVAQLLPRHVWVQGIATLLMAAGFYHMTGNFAEERDRRVASMDAIPNSALAEWTHTLGDAPQKPTFGLLQFVFTAFEDRILSFGFLKNHGDRIDFEDNYPREVPTARKIDEYRGFLASAYFDMNQVRYLLSNGVMHSAGRHFVDQYRLVNQIRDKARFSMSVSYSQRIEDVPLDGTQPRMFIATPDGAVELKQGSECRVEIPLDRTLLPFDALEGLHYARVPLTFGTELKDLHIHARVVLRPVGADGTPADGFVVHSPSRDEERQLAYSIRNRIVPLLSRRASLGLTGQQLSTGEYGRDLLLVSESPGYQGVLAVYLMGQGVWQRLELSLALPPGERCTEARQSALAGVAQAATRPATAMIMDSNRNVTAGTPVTFDFDIPTTGTISLLGGGKVLKMAAFSDRKQVSMTVDQSGSYAVGLRLRTPGEATGFEPEYYQYITVN
ncbi:MAG: glycosyltransferase family 39 protein [Chromatiales bacterium]|nr:glycosyltransferase family 39 protein [Chromatiales bacterium]